MARIPLLGGSYVSRSLIANVQRCVNIFPEDTPKVNQAPVPVTHILTPGLVELVQPQVARVRGSYRATNGALYVVIGTGVYFVDTDFTFDLLGTIGAGANPVSMYDNGSILVLVDGTPDVGYWVSLLAGSMLNTIVDVAFYGADFVCYIDGFLIFNRRETNQFYISPPFWNGTDPFDVLDIAAKIGGPDDITGVIANHRELWLVGQVTTEVWYNEGGADFPFARQPGVFVEHGMLLGYSLARADVNIFWLGRDRQGQGIVFQSQDYNAERISNHALEDAIQSYAVVNDAIGMTYQKDGHTFYILTFPTADKTWVYDLATKQWHERTWTDDDGGEHRSRANTVCAAYNKIIVGDHTNGKLYAWAADAYDDDGSPIVRRRGFPHLVNDGKRISYSSFIADMEPATGDGEGVGAGRQVMLRWSDTRGKSWGDPIQLEFGATGEFERSLLARRLGMARDRVFELFWSFPSQTALNGAWIEVEKAET